MATGEEDGFVGALEELYRSRFDRFLRVAEAVCGDAEVARDAVQDGFARAIRFRAGYRGEAPLEGWVWRIVVNSARRSAASAGAAERWHQFEPATSNGGGRDPSGELGRLIEGLPERQRLVLFLRYYADLEYTAIAEALGITAGTVGATLNAARASLRTRLAGVEHG